MAQRGRSGVGRSAVLLVGTLSGAFFSKKGSDPTSRAQDDAARERDERRAREKAAMERERRQEQERTRKQKQNR